MRQLKFADRSAPVPASRHAPVVFVLGLLGCLGATTAVASDKAYYVMAPVLSTTPITVMHEIERPVRHCTEYQDDRRNHSNRRERRTQDKRKSRGIVGGLIGGLIGSQFGGGTGRKVLTVIGALAGSAIAKDIDRERREHDEYNSPRRTCRTTYEYETVEDIDGFEVVYEYAGQEFIKTVPADPGDEIRIRVELSPEMGR